MRDSLATDSSSSTDLRERIITAGALLPIAILASLAGGWLFVLLILPVLCVGMLEFYVMEKDTTMQGSSLTGIPTGIAIVLGFFLNQDWLWQLAVILGIFLTLMLEYSRQPRQPVRALKQVGTTMCGVIYIAFPAAFLIVLRNAPQDGVTWLFVVYAITWGTDTFAYVFGKTFGRTKLAPLISPNKTVEGAVGGILGAWIPAFCLLLFSGAFQPVLIPMIVAGPFLAVSGDLFESALKRFFRVKDSYVAGFNVFPGHGGVLDRIDALVWVGSWVFLYLFAVGLL
ncbi:MAG: phosphatidate cytidylyltransferase [Chloroflexi bacterium]|nr:phosphatidate cytidylyltransferase [Chloroflexota bacterium]MCY3978998.1 phosphatidate cytidylyltransferase [Chloroflexota bacterium]